MAIHKKILIGRCYGWESPSLLYLGSDDVVVMAEPSRALSVDWLIQHIKQVVFVVTFSVQSPLDSHSLLRSYCLHLACLNVLLETVSFAVLVVFSPIRGLLLVGIEPCWLP